MATSQKAVSLMRNIKEQIKRRLSSYTFTDGLDSDGNPLLLVSADSSPATTEQVALIRVKPVALVFTNSIGNTQENMSPHNIEICLEADSSLTATARMTEVNQAIIKSVLYKQGGINRSYLLASGSVPAIADVATQMVAANLVAETYLDDSFHLMGS